MKRLAMALLALAACKPLPLPDEPDVVIVATDAGSLRDAGPDASPCAVFCAHLAAPEPPCREANGACLPACDLAVRRGLLSPDTLTCVARAGSRHELQMCGALCP